jgi:two-component system cell cycle response regulator
MTARVLVVDVLLDVMMAGIDGIEVCRCIKSNPQTQDIPVVMVTTLDNPRTGSRASRPGPTIS